MSKVEKIKAEIERLKNELSDNKERLNLGEIIAVNNCYNNLIFFIDSLSDTEKDFGINNLSNDLEEAATKYAQDKYFPVQTWQAFKEGAQWQKQQDQSTIELAEDHAYLAGQEKIIAKACEWLLKNDSYSKPTELLVRDFKKVMEE